MDSNHHMGDAEIETTDALGEFRSTYLDQIYKYVIYQVQDKAIAEYITEGIFLEASGDQCTVPVVLTGYLCSQHDDYRNRHGGPDHVPPQY